MWNHLSDAQLMDVLDGQETPRDAAHVAECPRCQGLVGEARTGLRLMEGPGEVPEPPGLYWETFRRQVGRRIAEDEPVGRFSWGALLAVAAVLVAAIGLLRAPHPSAPTPVEPKLAAWSALPPDENDSGLALIQALGPSPDEIAPAAGCESVSDCVVDRLSEEESHAFLERMKTEPGGNL
jgi:hypothetical protein